MHTLFSTPNGFNAGVSTLPNWNNARQNLYTEINKLVRYFRESSEWVKNTNTLVKILKSDNTQLYDNTDYTLEAARDRWLKDAETFGINTPYRRANYMPDNVAYPNNVKEYIAMDDSIPYGSEVKIKWRDLEPIKVLDHPYHDLNLSIPNGKFQGEKSLVDSVFLSINIPLLVLQYRLWQRYEAERLNIDPDNPAMFLARYPLVNIMNTHMDIVLRNRFINFYYGIEPLPFKVLRQGGVVVNDTSNFVDRSLREAVKIISSKDLRFFELNQQIPQLSTANVAQSLVLPDMSYTRAIRWVYDASRINWLSFLVKYNNDRGLMSNNSELDYMRRRFRIMANDKEFQSAVGLNAESHYSKLRSLLGL